MEFMIGRVARLLKRPAFDDTMAACRDLFKIDKRSGDGTFVESVGAFYTAMAIILNFEQFPLEARVDMLD